MSWQDVITCQTHNEQLPILHKIQINPESGRTDPLTLSKMSYSNLTYQPIADGSINDLLAPLGSSSIYNRILFSPLTCLSKNFSERWLNVKLCQRLLLGFLPSHLNVQTEQNHVCWTRLIAHPHIIESLY